MGKLFLMTYIWDFCGGGGISLHYAWAVGTLTFLFHKYFCHSS